MSVNADVLLDNPAAMRNLDPSGMCDAIAGMPDQLRQATSLVAGVDWKSYKPTTPAGICLCGMGGSAIGGDLARSYWESQSPVPFVVVRTDHLPAYINRFWLVIASSYSGNTAETLTATHEARARGCSILAVTTGGQLAALASTNKWPLVKLPGGLPPRAALGYSFGPVMLSLSRWGIVADYDEHLQSLAGFLHERQYLFQPDTPLLRNPAKQHAVTLTKRIVNVYGSNPSTDVVAYRLKCQLAENSKAIAFANALPELNHNEIVGLDAQSHPGMAMAVVTLASDDDDTTAAKRRLWIERRLAGRGLPVVRLEASGRNRLERMFSLVQQGDWISYYLAIQNGQDPTPVPAINDLKTELA